MRKFEVSAVNMKDSGAATVLSEIESLIVEHIARKGLKRMIKVKGGK
jgi:hypothetical protein